MTRDRLTVEQALAGVLPAPFTADEWRALHRASREEAERGERDATYRAAVAWWTANRTTDAAGEP